MLFIDLNAHLHYFLTIFLQVRHARLRMYLLHKMHLHSHFLLDTVVQGAAASSVSDALCVPCVLPLLPLFEQPGTAACAAGLETPHHHAMPAGKGTRP
jgi:hypothetical protein